MNVPVTKMLHYLFNPNSNVDIKYVENTYSGEIKVTSFLTPDGVESLNSSAHDKYVAFTDDITVKVRNQMRQLSFYRYVSITLLMLFIILPSLISFFVTGGHWVVIFGVYYSFFAYLIVEAYIQASRNYFEDKLFKEFQHDYLNQ